MQHHVILVPGIGLYGVELLLLKKRLCQAGFAARIFYYWAWCRTLEECIDALQRYINARPGDVISFVAHSFGGLVVVGLCARGGLPHTCRIVTLGTPHHGSAAARRVGNLPAGPWLLGRALNTGLHETPVRLRGLAVAGTVAGSFDTGIGRLLGLREPNDSVVCVSEAHHPDAVDTLTIRVSHSAMLISKRVAKEISLFLKNGRFSRER